MDKCHCVWDTQHGRGKSVQSGADLNSGGLNQYCARSPRSYRGNQTPLLNITCTVSWASPLTFRLPGQSTTCALCRQRRRERKRERESLTEDVERYSVSLSLSLSLRLFPIVGLCLLLASHDHVTLAPVNRGRCQVSGSTSKLVFVLGLDEFKRASNRLTRNRTPRSGEIRLW